MRSKSYTKAADQRRLAKAAIRWLEAHNANNEPQTSQQVWENEA